jgi:hypothetical protein
LKKVSLKGVIIGSVIDIIATNLAAIPVIVYASISHNLASPSKDQVSSELMLVVQNAPVLFSIQLLLGSLCLVLGGYIAARIAKHNEVLNGALASFLCVGIGLYAVLSSTSSILLWQHLFGVVASPALAAFGGYLRLRAVRGKANAQTGGRPQ